MLSEKTGHRGQPAVITVIVDHVNRDSKSKLREVGDHCALSRCELVWDRLMSSVNPGRGATALGASVTGVIGEGLRGQAG